MKVGKGKKEIKVINSDIQHRFGKEDFQKLRCIISTSRKAISDNVWCLANLSGSLLLIASYAVIDRLLCVNRYKTVTDIQYI